MRVNGVICTLYPDTILARIRPLLRRPICGPSLQLRIAENVIFSNNKRTFHFKLARLFTVSWLNIFLMIKLWYFWSWIKHIES